MYRRLKRRLRRSNRQFSRPHNSVYFVCTHSCRCEQLSKRYARNGLCMDGAIVTIITVLTWKTIYDHCRRPVTGVNEETLGPIFILFNGIFVKIDTRRFGSRAAARLTLFNSCSSSSNEATINNFL